MKNKEIKKLKSNIPFELSEEEKIITIIIVSFEQDIFILLFVKILIYLFQ